MAPKTPRKRKEHTPSKKEESPTKTSGAGATKPAQSENTQDDLPARGIPYRRMAIRFVLVFGSVVVFNVFSKWQSNGQTFAGVADVLPRKAVSVPCSGDYEEEIKMFPACTPKKCGRFVMDGVIDRTDAEHLLKTAKAGLALGGSNGGASILDIHSGALSKGDRFINIFQTIADSDETVFTEKDFEIYRNVKNRIHSTIAEQFGVPRSELYLTSPTFFSRMTNKPAKTIHDEYWHVHVDKETYGSFHYTSLLYLTTYGTDFTGGRFVFVDEGKNTTVEPKLGRLSFFSSGSENPHQVEPVKSGTRFAITVSFTCNPDKAIADPLLKSK